MPRKICVPNRLIILLAAVAAIWAAAPASAEVPGRVTYTPTNTSYRYEGKHGTFTGDAIYAHQQPDGGNRLVWSLQLSPYVQSLVHGNTMACGAYAEGKRGYSDHHPSIPADYRLHSAITHLQLDTQYVLIVNCQFTAYNGHTTAPGRVDFTVEFTLRSK